MPVDAAARRTSPLPQPSSTASSPIPVGAEAAGPEAVAAPAAAPAARNLANPNGFSVQVSGRNPPVAGGNWFEQLLQGWKTANIFDDAARSVSSGGRTPADSEVCDYLAGASLTPLKGDKGSQTIATYRSVVPAASPQQLFMLFTGNPEEVFKGTGMKLRPEAPRLRDGMKLMFQDQGPPAVWLPVQVRLSSDNRQISFHTLDGHPLRGSNTFNFKSAGPGKVMIEQVSHFQASSSLSSIGMSMTNALDYQHDFWKRVHDGFYARMAPFAQDVP